MIPYPFFHLILLTLLWKDQVGISIFSFHMRNILHVGDLRGKTTYLSHRAEEVRLESTLSLNSTWDLFLSHFTTWLGSGGHHRLLRTQFSWKLSPEVTFHCWSCWWSLYFFIPHMSLGWGRPGWGYGGGIPSLQDHPPLQRPKMDLIICFSWSQLYTDL